MHPGSRIRARLGLEVDHDPLPETPFDRTGEGGRTLHGDEADAGFRFRRRLSRKMQPGSVSLSRLSRVSGTAPEHDPDANVPKTFRKTGKELRRRWKTP
jgi:hypothetical protein